jgi:putative PIN family toxin of toxin-antitoxin system
VKAVLDTNVLVSALLTKGGTCARVLRLMAEGLYQLCVDGRNLAEYTRILHDPRLPLRANQASETLELIELVALLVDPPPLSVSVLHEDDLPFLEVAAAAGAVLVTGNKRHFPKRVCKSVRVVSPAEFLELLRRPL